MQFVFERLKNFRSKNRQRVFIVPTRFGFVLALFLFVMLLGAINYSNSMGHLLVFLLVSLAHTTMLHTHRNIAKIELKHCHAAAVFCGQAAEFQVVLHNPTQRTFRQLKLAHKNTPTTGWQPFQFFRGYRDKQTVDHILPFQSATAVMAIDTEQRGYQSLGQLRVSSHFPLGLFTSWTLFNSDGQVLVYPKPAGNLPLPVSHDQGEHFHSSNHIGLDDFAGFNKYRAGAPAHSIAWKALAKDDVLRTKHFTAAQSYRCCLRWQDTVGDTEARLSQLCQWLLETEKSGIATRLELPQQIIDYGVGEAHLKHCLTALAMYDA